MEERGEERGGEGGEGRRRVEEGREGNWGEDNREGGREIERDM